MTDTQIDKKCQLLLENTLRTYKLKHEIMHPRQPPLAAGTGSNIRLLISSIIEEALKPVLYEVEELKGRRVRG